MKLLPDIYMDSRFISLQDPFVVDGYIVTDIEVYGNNMSCSTFNGNFSFDLHSLWCRSVEILNRNYLCYLDSGCGYYIKYEDDNGRIVKPLNYIEYDSYTFCEWIKSRHSNLHSNNTTDRIDYISKIIDRLNAQNRIPSTCSSVHMDNGKLNRYLGVDEFGNTGGAGGIYSSLPSRMNPEPSLNITSAGSTGYRLPGDDRLHSNCYVVRETFNDVINRVATRYTTETESNRNSTYTTDHTTPAVNQQSCATNSNLSNIRVDEVTSGTMHFNDGSTMEVIHIRDNSRSNRSEKVKNYIHTYNYVPDKYMKHYMDNEDPATTLLLGVEIEVGGNDVEFDKSVKNDVIKNSIQIINGSDSDKEDLIYSTHDGTVQIELDTMPCSLEFHRQKMNYKELFKYLDSYGYKGHDCKDAGLHIHVNRDYLGKTKLQQQLVISKILYIIEKFNDEFCVVGRRNTYYSQFVGDRAKDDTALNLFSKYTKEGKRAALNLMHKDTIEFRMFKSTLKYETFMLTLEFVKDIIDFAKNTDIEEIEMITWGDLMQTFSDELQKYYNDRYNKMLDKDIDKKIDHLKKLIASKKNDIGKAKNYLAKALMNKELSKLQTELKKCETKRNKDNKKTVDDQTITDARGIWGFYDGLDLSTAYLR